MKRIPLKPVSNKRKAILSQEAIIEKLLLEKCGGKCMLCGKYAPLERSHTRKRDRFILVCRECHEGGNKLGNHKYLEDV